MKKDAIAEALRKDKVCKTILEDIVNTFPTGQKSAFNRPGYVSYAIPRLFPRGSVSQDKFSSSFRFYQEQGLIEIGNSTIEVKEKALQYV